MVRLLPFAAAAFSSSLSVFQSHNGAIAAPLLCVISMTVFQFQSHNGAIAAESAPKGNQRLNWFQSHNGAIAADTPRKETLRSKFVSIPQWCDCCRKRTTHSRDSPCSFNPTMVRLLQATQAAPDYEQGGFNPTMVRLLHLVLTAKPYTRSMELKA